MNIADLLYDREKLRSSIKKWKWLFFGTLIIFVIIFNKDHLKNSENYIAKINIEGVIDHNKELNQALKKIEKNPKIQAVILHIDSPGGTSFAGEELYEIIKKLKTSKPVVAVLGTIAASGGYMVALACDHIIARNMTLTGSIGVLSQSFEVTELANKLGIKFESFKSSPLKASPNPMEATSIEAKNATMESINDSYNIFLNMLIESRKLNKAQALTLANGKVYIGKRAKDLNLIDEIGGEDEAINWLESKKNIPKSTIVKEIIWNKPSSLFEELTKFLKLSTKISELFLGNVNSSIIAK